MFNFGEMMEIFNNTGQVYVCVAKEDFDHFLTRLDLQGFIWGGTRTSLVKDDHWVYDNSPVAITFLLKKISAAAKGILIHRRHYSSYVDILPDEYMYNAQNVSFDDIESII